MSCSFGPVGRRVGGFVGSVVDEEEVEVRTVVDLESAELAHREHDGRSWWRARGLGDNPGPSALHDGRRQARQSVQRLCDRRLLLDVPRSDPQGFEVLVVSKDEARIGRVLQRGQREASFAVVASFSLDEERVDERIEALGFPDEDVREELRIPGDVQEDVEDRRFVGEQFEEKSLSAAAPREEFQVRKGLVGIGGRGGGVEDGGHEPSEEFARTRRGREHTGVRFPHPPQVRVGGVGLAEAVLPEDAFDGSVVWRGIEDEIVGCAALAVRFPEEASEQLRVDTSRFVSVSLEFTLEGPCVFERNTSCETCLGLEIRGHAVCRDTVMELESILETTQETIRFGESFALLAGDRLHPLESRKRLHRVRVDHRDVRSGV